MTTARQSTALRVGQAQASSLQVFLKDAVLFPQVIDHLNLVAIHPSGQRHQEDPPADGVEHAPSLQAALRVGRSAEFSDSPGNIFRHDWEQFDLHLVSNGD
jgi:hypothetical protein